jgi:hypothetical protein
VVTDELFVKLMRECGTDEETIADLLAQEQQSIEEMRGELSLLRAIAPKRSRQKNVPHARVAVDDFIYN